VESRPRPVARRRPANQLKTSTFTHCLPAVSGRGAHTAASGPQFAIGPPQPISRLPFPTGRPAGRLTGRRADGRPVTTNSVTMSLIKPPPAPVVRSGEHAPGALQARSRHARSSISISRSGCSLAARLACCSLAGRLACCSARLLLGSLATRTPSLPVDQPACHQDAQLASRQTARIGREQMSAHAQSF